MHYETCMLAWAVPVGLGLAAPSRKWRRPSAGSGRLSAELAVYLWVRRLHMGERVRVNRCAP